MKPGVFLRCVTLVAAQVAADHIHLDDTSYVITHCLGARGGALHATAPDS